MLNSDAIENQLRGLSEDEWKSLYLAHARGERTDLLPFPGEEVQQITNRLHGERTARGAISILDCMFDCVREARPLSRDMRVLDYGCGWGRITRLLPYYFQADGISGVDVDERLIDSAQALLPFLDHRQITSMQPLPFADAEFDLIMANSVFSHLSEKSCLFALGELARILAPGGVLVISALEQHEMDKFYGNDDQLDWITGILGPQGEALATLEEKGFIWGTTGRWEEYGIAIMQTDWLRQRFDEIGIDYVTTKRSAHRGSHNYKTGVKR